MKYLLFIVLTIMISSLYSQDIKGKSLSEIDAPYISVQINRGMGTTHVVKIDYGQAAKANSAKDQMLNKDGKQMVFDSPMAVLAFLVGYGYDLFQITGQGNGQLYVMRKKE